MSSAHPPHRIEDGLTCIDIRIRSLAQLFDSRDPVPFHDCSLDGDAMDTVMAFAEELHDKTPFKLVFHLPVPAPSSTGPVDPRADLLPAAISQHFRLAAARAHRRQKRESRQGRVKLLVGLAAFVILLTASELLREIATSAVTKLIPEGLTILAWVVMWRPLDALLFDWFPFVAERRLCLRIASAPVVIRHYTP